MDVTPKTVPTKRLGLSRSVGKNPNSSPTSKNTRTLLNTNDQIPDTKATSSKLNDEAASGKTKNLSMKSNVSSVSSKSNKGTYKLSLCKKTTEAMTRKRMLSQQSKLLMQPKRLKLEPNLDDLPTKLLNSENCDIKLPSSDDCKIGFVGEKGPCLKLSNEDATFDDWGANESPSNLSTQEEIDEIKKKIAMYTKRNEIHKKKKSELQGLKTKWREAGRIVIEEIQEKIPAKHEDEILAHFQIDPGLFQSE